MALVWMNCSQPNWKQSFKLLNVFSDSVVAEKEAKLLRSIHSPQKCAYPDSHGTFNAKIRHSA